MKKVLPSSRSGSWDAEMGFRTRAKRTLEYARDASARQESVRAARQKEHPFTGEALRELRALYDEYRIFTDSTVLFSALAIESFLNFYGVVRVGEEFYRSHYERLGPVAKFSALVATCLGELVEKGDEATLLIRDISAARNALAHPKATEVEFSTIVVGPPRRLQVAEESVTRMERFFEIFLEMDPGAAWLVSHG